MDNAMRDGTDEVLRELPYGVYVVTAYGPDGEHGLTASWVMQVSKSPPLVAVALRTGGTSEQIVAKSGAFAVNVLPTDGEETAERFVTPIDRFNTPPFPGVTWGESQLPLLAAAMAWLECRVVQRVTTGDHTLFIGEVVRGRMKEDALPMTTLDSGLGYGGTKP